MAQDNSDMDLCSESSIEELEYQRQALLAELQDSEDHSNPPLALEYDPICTSPSSGAAVQSNSKTLKATPQRCLSREMGTPVSIRFSPYSSLPSREKFGDGMGDMLHFENLPNTTGTFQKMKSLLLKVRDLFQKK